jgi:very-short-patch-repair endonuclease
LDFYCAEARLAIELDGSGHGYVLRSQRDRERDDIFAKGGIRILRFWNDEIRENLDGVLQAIWFALEERSGRNPSP